jgi:hypothetical protein
MALMTGVSTLPRDRALSRAVPVPRLNRSIEGRWSSPVPAL